MTIKQLKMKRVENDLTSHRVAVRAGMDYARLSRMENGYVEATPQDLKRIDKAIDDLVEARKEVEAVAERVGWTL